MAYYLNENFDGVARLAPKWKDEWPPFPSNNISHFKPETKELVVSLSVDLTNQET